ncbi:MAG: hypothetical protein NC907_02325, partial [Candidatus Omnitrophica bacterium]|nr:hypothetical protein [Candidatus Omnitrophota bacterium]
LKSFHELRSRMNSKKLVRECVELRSANYVPLDLWATPETIARLCDFFSTTKEGVLKKLDIDIRYVGFDIKNSDFEKQKDGSFQKKIGDNLYEDIWGVKRKKVSLIKGEYLELYASPFQDVQDIKTIEKFKLPSVSDFDIEKEKLAFSRDYAIIFTGDRLSMRASFFKLAMYLRGFENFLIDLLTNQKLAETIINRLFEFHYEIAKRNFETYSGNIDIFLMGDDLGTQTGPLIGLDVFRRFFKKPLRKMIDLCHKYNIKAMLHSCGSVKIFMPDLIEIGLDILNPVQHTAFDMDLEELKREFGKFICFHGAIDVQNILVFGTKKDIENEIRQCIEILGKNGGYICAPSHNLQVDIPVENIIHMYQFARSIG